MNARARRRRVSQRSGAPSPGHARVRRRPGAAGASGTCRAGAVARATVPRVHRWVALLALTGCETTALPTEPPKVWLSLPGPSGFPLGAVRGRLGRSQTPEPLVDLGLPGPAGAFAPLTRAAGFALPGDGPAHAVLFGSDDDRPAIDLIDID